MIGALVCGSYITGKPNKHSDIDVFILLNSEIIWKERGTETIDGFRIHYFVNSARGYREYAEIEFKKREKIIAYIFCVIGKTIFDKTGELGKLKEDLKDYFTLEYPKPNRGQVELEKYFIWDMCDNLEEIFETNGGDFYFVFYIYLNELFKEYSKFLQFDHVFVYDIGWFLMNKKCKKRQHSDKIFPDPDFVRMYVNAIALKDKEKLMIEYKKITKHTLDKMGGFDISNWKITNI